MITIRSDAPEARSFWLYPTWGEQAEGSIKRAWHGELARSNRERRADGRVPVRCHCTVEETWEVSDPATLKALDPTHLWADVRPPATVVLLRASALVEPCLVEPAAGEDDQPWAALTIEPSVADLIPALTDDAFALHAARVRGAM